MKANKKLEKLLAYWLLPFLTGSFFALGYGATKRIQFNQRLAEENPTKLHPKENSKAKLSSKETSISKKSLLKKKSALSKELTNLTKKTTPNTSNKQNKIEKKFTHPKLTKEITDGMTKQDTSSRSASKDSFTKKVNVEKMIISDLESDSISFEIQSFFKKYNIDEIIKALPDQKKESK